MGKRAIAVVSALMLMLLLTGCSVTDGGILQGFILDASGISEDEDYLTYKEYEEAGLLDEDGYYSGDLLSSSEEISEMEGTVHVTFASNRYLQITYYTDAEQTNLIDVDACYLNPGDSIYSSTPLISNTNSNLYQLSRYQIYEYEDDSTRTLLYEQTDTSTNLVYTIPDTFTGTELSILPIGEYPDREIALKAYYVDDSGNQVTLSSSTGTWYVNDEKVSRDTVEISSVSSYVVKYEYDKDDYFYVSASPSPFTGDPQSVGYVEFWEAGSTDASESYSVELHAYLSLEVTFNDAEATVSLNNDDAETIAKGKSWSSDTLQYGDVIIIETDGGCSITGGDYRHITATKNTISGGYRYTLTVTDEVGDNLADVLGEVVSVENRTFTVTLETQGDYGTAAYTLDGEKVTGIQTVQEGQELKITYTITDRNYEFAEATGGVFGWWNDLFYSNERTATIPIDANLDNQTIDPDDWFEIVGKDD